MYESYDLFPSLSLMSSFIPERSTTEWQALDAAHYIHPFTDHAALSKKGTRVITRAVPHGAVTKFRSGDSAIA